MQDQAAAGAESRRWGWPCAVVVLLTAALTAVTIGQALERYRDLRTGWSWDLAYYNQWFWALTKGDGQLTVRPIASYATEGPSVWKTNYLAPIRFAIAPIYAAFPDPRTLLVVHVVVFWWVVPAAYGLARRESGSDLVGLLTAGLVPLTPLLWPLAWNDFRELQMALPFVLWAIDGVRGRSVRLAAVGIGGMLACRQEFALIVATFAVLPPRGPEDLGRSYRWARALVVVGLGWFLFAFFGYLHWWIAGNAHELYVEQFGGPKAGLVETVETAADFLLIGMGSWALLAAFAPRLALLALPWLWSLSNGRWALRLIGTEQWHHVRYAAPMAAMVLAAGVVGFARLGGRLRGRRHGRAALVAVWLAAAAGLGLADRALFRRFAQVEYPFSRAEAAEVWRLIEQVGPDEGVLAVYDVTAPLSSRRVLFSYILDQNKPPGYPTMPAEVGWVFLRNGDLRPETLTDQGFRIVHRGPFLAVFRRG